MGEYYDRVIKIKGDIIKLLEDIIEDLREKFGDKDDDISPRMRSSILTFVNETKENTIRLINGIKSLEDSLHMSEEEIKAVYDLVDKTIAKRNDLIKEMYSDVASKAKQAGRN